MHAPKDGTYEDVATKRCSHPGCKTKPSFGPVGGPRTSADRCAEHTPQDGSYENVVTPRCPACPLQPAKFVHAKSAGGLCFHCDPDLWRTLKRKEEAFAAALAAAGFREATSDALTTDPSHPAFRRELPVAFRTCSLGVERAACDAAASQRARLDFVFESEKAVVIAEIDEWQHADRCVRDEVARANEAINALWLGGNRRPVLLVRLNPDTFRVDGAIKRVAAARRHARAIALIRAELFAPRGATETWSIQMMYYDTEGAERRAVTTRDPDFEPAVAALCRPVIVA